MRITVEQEHHEVLDYQCYTQHLIAVFYNRITALSSNRYLSQFGLGSIEMRVLASIASHPLQKAAYICSLISIDKAAVSRAIAKLDRAGFIIGSTEAPAGKQKRWSLSESGWKLHSEFLEVIKARQQSVTQGIADEELIAFTETLHKLIANLDRL